MKLVGKDYYIDYNKGVYHLHFLKNKKEIKEDAENTYKIGGYFTNLDNAFKEIIKFRQHKKYAFKEEWKMLIVLLNTYLKRKKSFNNDLKQIYSVISILKRKLFKYEKTKKLD